VPRVSVGKAGVVAGVLRCGIGVEAEALLGQPEELRTAHFRQGDRFSGLAAPLGGREAWVFPSLADSLGPVVAEPGKAPVPVLPVCAIQISRGIARALKNPVVLEIAPHASGHACLEYVAAALRRQLLPVAFRSGEPPAAASRSTREALVVILKVHQQCRNNLL